MLNYESLKQNKIYKAKIIQVSKYGLFVRINKNIKGLVHYTKAFDHFIKKSDYLDSKDDYFTIGDEVQVRMLQLDKLETDKPRLSLEIV